jgi:YD repeat-containing protein
MKSLRAAPILIFLFVISISLSAEGQENTSLDPKLTSAADLAVPAGTISLQLQRKLETGRTQRGLLGIRWRLNWESHLSRAGRLVQIEDWAGIVSFTQVGQQPEYTNDSGERITFTKDGGAVRTRSNAGSEAFDTTGRLIERTYHHGNKVSLRYDAQGRLARVEGPAGSFLQFWLGS